MLGRGDKVIKTFDSVRVTSGIGPHCFLVFG